MIRFSELKCFPSSSFWISLPRSTKEGCEDDYETEEDDDDEFDFVMLPCEEVSSGGLGHIS